MKYKKEKIYIKIKKILKIFILTLIIFLNINLFTKLNTKNIKNKNKKEKGVLTKQKLIIKEKHFVNDFNNLKLLNEKLSIAKNRVNDRTLIIDEINLSAKIKKGVDEETLNKYIGHFEETPIVSGNTCLAAHNRGYEVNYFENLHKLKFGSKIEYIIGDLKYVYLVKEIKIIKDTDWEILYNTSFEKNITLITCVKDEPNLRLAIHAEYLNID